MRKSSKMRSYRPSAKPSWPSAEASSRRRRLATTVGGIVAGTLAARTARPLVRRAATRYGVPATGMIWAVEMAMPLAALTIARRIDRNRSSGPRRRFSLRERIAHRSRRTPVEEYPGAAGDHAAGTRDRDGAYRRPEPEPATRATRIPPTHPQGAQPAPVHGRPDLEGATPAGGPAGPVIDMR